MNIKFVGTVAELKEFLKEQTNRERYEKMKKMMKFPLRINKDIYESELPR